MDSRAPRATLAGVFGRSAVVGTLVAAAAAACAPAAGAAECPNSDGLKVPGAEMQMQACLDDLTTAGTQQNGHTDRSDWQGLAPANQRNPSGVPGLQIDGYMPDTSKSNGTHNWNHDSQFVIRMPDKWNGKLVVTGAPGVRKQYAADPIIGDFVLSWGYAYASTDKGNNGTSFYKDGGKPGDSGVEWNSRVTELTIAAKDVLRQRYGRAPDRTYVTGISQGGYLTRWQLENRPDLYDGGVDWEGTLWQSEAPNLFTYLAASLKYYPRYRAGDQAAHDAMIAAGFAPGSEFLWEDHYAVYWDLTQRTYREEFDPDYDGSTEAGTPFCQSGMPACDADYDYAARQPIAGPAIKRIENTGNIGKPMITLQGTLDSLLPISANADAYRRKVERAGRQDIHRYWVIEHGNHVDGRYDAFPDRLKPVQPCWQVAFKAMTEWVEKGAAPPPDQFVPDDRSGANADVVNTCAVPRRADATAGGRPVPGAGPFPAPGQQVARTRPRGMRIRLRPRRDRSAPYRFRVTGRLRLQPGIAPSQACGSGEVLIRVRAASRRAALRPDCTFRATLRLRARSHHGRSRVRVGFGGNRALYPLRVVRRGVRVR